MACSGRPAASFSACVFLPRRVASPGVKSDASVLRKKNTPRRAYLKGRYRELSPLFEAIAAIHRTVVSRLERNLAGLSARSTNSVKHLAGSSSAIFTRCTAGRASLGFISESFFFEEILLACSECEFLPAVYAYERFVLMSQSVIPRFFKICLDVFQTFYRIIQQISRVVNQILEMIRMPAKKLCGRRKTAGINKK